MSNPEYTNPDKALRTGEVAINKVLMIDRLNQSLDISLMMAEINLFGELLSPFMTGSIILNDNIGLLYETPLNGEETLILSLTSSMSQTNKNIIKVFKVVSIDKILTTAEGSTKTYELHLISIIGYLNNLYRIKKRYDGNCTHIVKDIVEEYFYTPYNDWIESIDDAETREQAQGSIEFLEDFIGKLHMPTVNNVSFVAANWTPAYTINWIATRAIADTPAEMGVESASYVFSETLEKLIWAPLEELIFVGRIKASPFYKNILGIWRFEYFPGSASRDPAQNYKTIIGFKHSKYINQLAAQESGLLASQVEVYDVITKRYRKEQIDWIEKHREFARIEDYREQEGIHYPDVGRYTFPFSPRLQRSYDNHTYSILTHNQAFPGFEGYTPERSAQQRNFRFAAFGQMALKITVYGRFEMTPGSIVHLDLPVNTPDPDRKARYVSGYYMVFAVRHKITLADHFTYAEIAKDSTRAILK